MKKIAFQGKVLFIGYGAVARCTLPILLKHVSMPPKNIMILDLANRRSDLAPWLEQGVHFVRQGITRQNMGALLGTLLGAGDLVIDLACNIDCCEILQWCHDQGVMYLNTAVALWNPYQDSDKRHPTEKTLYWRHMKVRRMIAGWKKPGPTAVLEHGANPGLISHWTKRGLVDIANRLLEDKKVSGKTREEIEHYRSKRIFSHLAWKLGVKVIHCSERDTQISGQPKQVNEFVNTWSIEGFREEGTAPAELGWGTHEREMPKHAFAHQEGPKNQICLARMGINTWVRSWVPNYPIVGMVVRHGEAFTISDRLTVWENGAIRGRVLYRPTVHYAYACCDSGISSLYELRARNYKLHPKLRIMNDEITSGSDILGALLMGHAYGSWWTGSNLSIEESRRLVPHQNATTVQVAISVVAAITWMLDHREMGVLVPDDLPHDYILDIADPYLGKSISAPSRWTPLQERRHFWARHNQPDLDRKDPWQFKNFLVADAE